MQFFFAFFRKKVNIVNIYLGRILYWNILSFFMLNIWYCKCLQQLSGDIELNPGPKPSSCKSFSICYWNLNRTTSHIFIKVHPPPYERTVWHYQQAGIELIKRSSENFDWKNDFSNCNPNEQESVLTKTLLNIKSNFIPGIHPWLQAN